MIDQFDMFAATLAAPTTDPLLGILVQLPDACGKCGDSVAVIGPGKGMHKASLSCNSCGFFRGWVSHAPYDFLAAITSKFGAPTTPIIIRRGQYSGGHDARATQQS
jgi:hypothetical protein